MRLLACQQDKTVEELPDFTGPVEYDDLLNHLVSRHRTPSGQEHVGALFHVEDADWSDPDKQRQIVQQIAAKLDGGETGLGSAFYDLKDTFQEDALTCFNAHNRNPACSDYKDDSKRLTSGNEAEIKRETGVDVRADRRSTRYLCEFCPVQSLVEAAQRRKAGLDK
jgi:hypothetical protein